MAPVSLSLNPESLEARYKGISSFQGTNTKKYRLKTQSSPKEILRKNTFIENKSFLIGKRK